MALLVSGVRPMVARSGAPMMQGPASQVAQPPVSGGADAKAAQAFVAPLTIGLNIERWRPTYLAWQGHPLATDTDYWAYLRGLGFTHVRMFLPWRTNALMLKDWVNGVEPSDADLDLFLNCAETAIRGGLRVLYECAETFGTDPSDYPTAVQSVLTRQATKIALRGTTRFPPDRIAIGPCAGWEQDSNADANPQRLALHRLLRARLGQYVLMTGAAQRCSPASLCGPDWVPPSDQRVILTVHDAPGVPTAAQLQAQQAAYDALSAANGGVPIVLTEALHGSQSYSNSWLDHARAYAVNQPLIRPTFWAATDGAWYRWNVSTTDLTIQPPLVTELAKDSALVQNTPAWLAQNPGVTPPAIPADPTPPTTGGTVGTPNTSSGVPTGPVTWFEDFNNGPGMMSHVWGNRDAVSFGNSVCRIQGIPWLSPDDGACGVMEPPFGTDWGHGYGYWEIKFRFEGGLGNGSGPCIGLWASDNSWPRAEEDMGEIDGNGTWYSAHHWDNGEGGGAGNRYQGFYVPGLDWSQWHVSGCLIRPGYLEYFIDGRSMGSTTNNVTRMFSDGGVNRVFFLMNRSSNTACVVDWCGYRPL